MGSDLSTPSWPPAGRSNSSLYESESGLSLNRVTKPAPSVVPSLRGILLWSRCHVYYSVFDISKFFCYFRIADRDYTSELLVSLFYPYPTNILPTLLGSSSVIPPSHLVTVPLAIMQHAPRPLLSLGFALKGDFFCAKFALFSSSFYFCNILCKNYILIM